MATVAQDGAQKVIITEEWIRAKLNLNGKNAEDVKSLGLPGSYQEKILDVGDSLRYFTRLTVLDLSRNAIKRLAGFENLKMLERLNLFNYYNNVQSMTELSRLKANSSLQDLDLRLNPVAREDADYRLLLIHMLPNLRRLDDRVVRDQQRKAALMQFSVEELDQLTIRPAASQTNTERPTNPRVALVASLARSPFDVNEDNGALISEMLKERETRTTASSNKSTYSELYSPQVVTQLNKAEGNSCSMASVQMKAFSMPAIETVQSVYRKYGSNNTAAVKSSDCTRETFSEQYPNIHSLVTSADLENQIRASTENFNSKTRRTYADMDTDALGSYNAVANFTPAVSAYISTSTQREERITEPPSIERAHDEVTADSRMFSWLSSISELSDRFWNGSKSLMKSDQFKSGMCELLKSWSNGLSHNQEESFDVLQKKLNQLQAENSKLQEKLLTAETSRRGEYMVSNEGMSSEESRIKNSYIRTQRDLEIVKNQLKQQCEQNERQAARISELEASPGAPSILSSTLNTGENHQTVRLQEENQRLKEELKSIRQRLEQADKIHEMATLLQQYQTSLVQTNEHLLRELSETKVRHERENQKLSEECSQLRQTLAELSTHDYISRTDHIKY